MKRSSLFILVVFFVAITLAVSAHASIVSKTATGWDGKTREVNYYELVQDMLRPANNVTKYVLCSDGVTECLHVPHFQTSSGVNVENLSTCSAISSPNFNNSCGVTDEFSQVGQLVSMSNDSRAMQGFLNTAKDLNINVSVAGSATKPYKYGLCWQFSTTNDKINKTMCSDVASDADSNTADALYKCNNNLNFNSTLRADCLAYAKNLTDSIITYEMYAGSFTSKFLSGIMITLLPAGGGNVATAPTNSGFFYSGYPGVMMSLFGHAYAATGNATYCGVGRNVSYAMLFAANYTNTTFSATPGIHYKWNATSGSISAICTNNCGPPSTWDYDDAPRGALAGEGAYVMNASGCTPPIEMQNYLQNMTKATVNSGGALAHTLTAHSPQFYTNGSASIAAQSGFYEHNGLGCAVDLWANQSNIGANCLDSITNHYDRTTKLWDGLGFGVYRQYFPINTLGMSIGLDNNTANVTNSNGSSAMPTANASILSNTNTITSDLQLFCNASAWTSNVTYSYEVYRNGTLNKSSYVTASYGSSDPCYQESANVSTACGGLNTGVYANDSKNFYVNYTIPNGTTNQSEWQIKLGNSAVTTNYTIPSLCYAYGVNLSTPTLQLRMQSNLVLINQGINTMIGSAYADCYNGTGWARVFTGGQTSSALSYSFTSCTPNTNDGDYSTYCTYVDGTSIGFASGYSTCSTSACDSASIYEEGMFWHYGLNGSVNKLVATIPVNQLVRTQSWVLSCRATDGTTTGSWVNSSAFTVQNTPPNASNIFVVDLTGSLNCSYSYNDTDNDAQGNSTFRWFRNNTLLSNTKQTLLSAGNYSLTDTLVCEVKPNDGVANGTATNSSSFVYGDVTAPTISLVGVPTSGTTSDVLLLSMNCTDVNPLAADYPKVMVTNPNSVVEGNFTLTFNATSQRYEKAYTFNTVGVYTNATFFCKDGSGNLATTVSSMQLTITAPGTTPTVGDGGGVADLSEKASCNLVVSPSSITLTVDQATQEVLLENHESQSFDPTFSFTSAENLQSEMQITNPIVTVLPGGKTSFGVTYAPSSGFKNGDVVLTLSSANCRDVVIPVRLSSSVSTQLFAGLFENGFDLTALVVEPVFSSQQVTLRERTPNFTIGLLAAILLVLFTGLFWGRFVESFERSEYGASIGWVLFTLGVTLFAVFFLVTIVRVVF